MSSNDGIFTHSSRAIPLTSSDGGIITHTLGTIPFASSNGDIIAHTSGNIPLTTSDGSVVTRSFGSSPTFSSNERITTHTHNSGCAILRDTIISSGTLEICKAVAGLLASQNLSSNNIDMITIKGVNPETRDKIVLQITPSDLKIRPDIVNDLSIDLNAPLSLEWISNNNQIWNMWLMKHGLYGVENVDWHLILKLFPNITPAAILSNPQNLQVILNTVLQLNKNTINWNGVLTEHKFDKTSIVSNPGKWEQLLVKYGAPEELVTNINWNIFLEKYPQVDENWIRTHPQDFITLLFILKEKSRQPIVTNLVPFTEFQDISASWVANNKDVWNLWLKENGVYSRPDINWEVFFKIHPNITPHLILKEPTRWAEIINEFISSKRIEEPPLIVTPRPDSEYLIVTPRPNSDHLINVNEPLSIQWVARNKPMWTAWLEKHGFQRTGNVDWNLLLKLYPNITPASISNNPQNLENILDTVAKLNNIGINWRAVLSTHKFDKASIVSNPDSWEQTLVENGAPKELVSNVDWNIFWKKYPHVDEAWIRSHPRDFIILLFISKEEIKKEQKVTKIPFTEFQAIPVYWIKSNKATWNAWLRENNIYVKPDINWDIFFKSFPNVTPQLFMDEPERWEIIINTFSASKPDSNIRQIPEFGSLGLNSPLSLQWMVSNKQIWNEWLQKQSIFGAENVDWNLVLKLYPDITPAFIANNPQKLQYIIDSILELNKIDINWNGVFAKFKFCNRCIRLFPRRWEDLLIKFGAPETLVRNIDWVVFFKEHQYINEAWIRDHPKEFVILLFIFREESKKGTNTSFPFTEFQLIPGEWINKNSQLWNSWLQENNAFVKPNIDWDILFKNFPYITPHLVLKHPKTWEKILSKYSSLKVPTSGEVSGLRSTKAILKQFKDVSRDWIIQNENKWIDMLRTAGLYLPDISWKEFLIKHPLISPQWILNNLETFLSIVESTHDLPTALGQSIGNARSFLRDIGKKILSKGSSLLSNSRRSRFFNHLGHSKEGQDLKSRLLTSNEDNFDAYEDGNYLSYNPYVESRLLSLNNPNNYKDTTDDLDSYQTDDRFSGEPRSLFSDIVGNVGKVEDVDPYHALLKARISEDASLTDDEFSAKPRSLLTGILTSAGAKIGKEILRSVLARSNILGNQKYDKNNDYEVTSSARRYKNIYPSDGNDDVFEDFLKSRSLDDRGSSVAQKGSFNMEPGSFLKSVFDSSSEAKPRFFSSLPFSALWKGTEQLWNPKSTTYQRTGSNSNVKARAFDIEPQPFLRSAFNTDEFSETKPWEGIPSLSGQKTSSRSRYDDDFLRKRRSLEPSEAFDDSKHEGSFHLDSEPFLKSAVSFGVPSLETEPDFLYFENGHGNDGHEYILEPHIILEDGSDFK